MSELVGDSLNSLQAGSIASSPVPSDTVSGVPSEGADSSPAPGPRNRFLSPPPARIGVVRTEAGGSTLRRGRPRRPRQHPVLDGLEKKQKRCRTCGEWKPLTSEFWPRDANQPDGFQGWCKDCKQTRQRAEYAANPEKYREAQLVAKFGMTNEDFERMRLAQGGGCAICGGLDSRSKLDPNSPAKHLSIAKLHVDHDYVTNEVRGLLCGPCNRGIGMFLDDADLLEKAIAYLRQYNAQPRGKR